MKSSIIDKLKNICDTDVYYRHLKGNWTWLGDMSSDYVWLYRKKEWLKSKFKSYYYE